MKDESPRSGPGPESHAERRANPDTEQLAAQMSALLADLVRTPQADLEDWTPSLQAGDRLGRFVLVRELGRGGMGVVWEAEDPELSRRVALKVVKPGANARVRGADWLRREAEAVARLSHPNIVTLHDFGLAGSGPFLVFELLRGLPLDQRLRGGPLPLEAVLAIAVEVGRALVHAHRAGVVHRDLKPANVHVSDSGQVKVLDFGLASLLGRTGPLEAGTPAFMAPEQWAGELGDARADLFALGVTLWAALTGGVPYPVRDGRSAALAPGPTPRLPAGCAPPRLRRLVERCVEREPARRPASAKAVLEELRAIQHGRQARGRRRLVAGLAAAVVAASGVAGWLWWAREPPPGERLVAVVADADNRSGDPDLDRVGELVAAALGESRRLAVVPRARLEAAARQARPGEARRLDGALARDLARVTGADLLLLPSAARDGGGLVLGLEGVDPKGVRPRFTLTEPARGPAEVTAALDRLTETARRRLQERREDLRAGGLELASAFSPSLEATRAYFDGLDCTRRTDAPGAPVDEACSALFERALALDPAFAQAHYQLAVRATPWGAPPERGRAHIEAALRGAERLPAREAALVRAWAAHLAGQDDEALRHYEALLARQPDDAEALERAGALEWYRGRYAAAVPYLQRRLALDPGDEQARLDLVEALGVTGRESELRALVAETRALPATPQRHRAAVEGLLRLGEPEAALALARAAHAEAPSPATRGALRIALEQAGRFEELEALLRADLGDAADRWYALAVPVAAQGRYREADGLLEEGRRRDPRRERADADAVRAVWLGDGHDPAAFRRALRRLLPRHPSSADTLAVLAALRGEAEAAAALLAAVAPAPGARAQVDALLAWRRGDAPAALAGLAALDRSDPEPVDGLHPSYLLAEVAAAAGEPQEALAALDRFARQPVKGYWSAWAWPRALLLRAQAHLALGERPQAREALVRLLATYRRADAGLPLLREARAMRARL